MIYFKKELVDAAQKIIDSKEDLDSIKALKYISDIDSVFQFYCNSGVYDSQYVIDLDKRIRNDYPLINEIEKAPSNGNGQYISNADKLPNDINSSSNAEVNATLL